MLRNNLFHKFTILLAPSEVSLLWRNSDDPCAGKDILFELLGFRLRGQVSVQK